METRPRRSRTNAAARRALALAILLALVVPLGLFPGARPARAAVYTITVNTEADTNNACAGTGAGTCSLRDAVRFANVAYGVDGSDTEIVLPEGTYTLTQPGVVEDFAAAGDLDIRAAGMTIRGTNAKTTFIDGNGTDRVLEIFSGASLTVIGIALRNGALVGDPLGCGFIPCYYGGGARVATGAALTLRFSAVAGGYAQLGGGISNRGTLVLEQSAIHDNRAFAGSGIFNEALLTASNSTISGNTYPGDIPPSTEVFRGGLVNYGGTATLVHLTIANNALGIGQDGGTATLRNAIVANSTGGPNCAGTIGDLGYNLDSGATCGFTAPGSASNADLRLAALSDSRLSRGTPFHGLGYGSAAVDRVPAVGAGCPTNEQNGGSRPKGAGCDSGAAEEGYSTRLAAADASGPPDGSAALTATLTEYASGLPVAGQTVTFYLNGALAGAAITGTDGVAATSGSLAGIAAGDYPAGVRATFLGDSLLGPSEAGAALTVTTASPPPAYTLTVTGTAGGAVTGGGSYPPGTVATATASADPGYVFTGWAFDGAPAGWPPIVTVTMNADHALAATFVPATAFGDVPAGASYAGPVRELAARGVINGCDASATPPLFCPAAPTLRAQMAALIVRAMFGWSGETWPNTFTDPIPDAELWRRVATLQHYNVAQGYQAEVCAAQGKTPPCFGPLDPVTYGQTILFIARAMVEHGYWTLQPDDPTLFPELVGTSEREVADHRAGVTSVHYAGAPPDVDATPGVPFRRAGVADGGWGDPSSRAWFTRALWQALDSYFSVDRVP